MKSISKNIGKLNQLVGEKLYSTSVNKHELTEEFKQMEGQLEVRKQGTELVLNSCNKFLYTMEKRKEGLDKNKHLPIANLGLAMSQFGFELGNLVADESAYGQALLKMGATEVAIADLQEEFAQKLRDSFVSKLESFMADIKHFKHLRSKLESRRLDYDAKSNKIQRAKKEKPDLDGDMRTAQQKYEETLLELEHLMISLSDREGPQLEGLYHFADAQIEYHKSAMVLAERLKVLLQDPNAKVEPVAVSSEAPSITLTSMSSTDVTPSQEKSLPTFSHLTIPRVVKSSNLISQSTNALSLMRQMHQRSMLSDHPFRQQEKQYARVLFEYQAQNPDELSIVEGDVITILNDEIDDGWWIGELNNIRGIFPIAYTEPASKDQIKTQSRKHKISEDYLTSGGESTDMSRMNSTNRLPHSSSWPKVVEDLTSERPDIVTTSLSNIRVDDGLIHETPFFQGSESNTNLIERRQQ